MPETAETPPLLSGRFQRAFVLAGELHGDQVRKGTTVPYLAHLMSVAALVLEHGGGEDAAIGGLLHDSIEDSADGTQTGARILREFGGRIAEIVAGCSDAVAVPGQDKPPWRERKGVYIARLAADGDLDVLLVSACDKLHNARAIVADLRILGPGVWDRFSQPDPASHLWYYESLAACYRGRVPDRLADELDRVLADMRTLADPPEVAAVAGD